LKRIPEIVFQTRERFRVGVPKGVEVKRAPDTPRGRTLRKSRDMISAGKVERGERKRTADEVSKAD
jgi:hypothetical protein